MTLSRCLYIFVVACLLAHAFLAYEIAGLIPGYMPLDMFNAHNVFNLLNWFTIPHLILLPLSIVAVVADAKLVTKSTLWTAMACLLCLLPSYYFAIGKWNSDGPGLAWLLVIGVASLINAIVGIPCIYAAHMSRLAIKQSRN